MHQEHRHINTQTQQQKKQYLGQTTSPDLTTPAVIASSSAIKMIRKRPDLTEVIRNLRFNGRNDVADLITKLSGTIESTEVDSVSSVNVSGTGTGSDLQVGSRSGSRRKKFAYLYVNSTKASMDDQSRMLHGFIQTLKARSKSRKAVAELIRSTELIPITLPKNVVVLAMRLPLEVYNGSVIPKQIRNHSFMKVYLRKPRSDTQHLASAKTIPIQTT